MTFLLPGECIGGTAAERAHLRLLLTCFRVGPPPMRLPEISGHPLPAMLESGIIDRDVFSIGQAIMVGRYKRLGIRTMLPLDRVWVGARSAAAPGNLRGWGGFHHPTQGYRHIQMDAVVTVYGDLTGNLPASPQSVALDLVRSYSHDCLHYATFRLYQLSNRGEIARVQYGINLRRPDGRSYSAADEPGEGPTRNLGILMEGATDAEATYIARQTAKEVGITVMKPDPGLPGLAFTDATGGLTTKAIHDAQASAHPYARSLGRFGGMVTVRYRALLQELADDPGQLHEQIVAAMTSGDRGPLEAWLDARHGPGCFARLFRAPSFGTGPEPVR
jgi:hypothetical protein